MLVAHCHLFDDAGSHLLHLEISFDPGAQFKDETGTLCPAYDGKQKQWRYINFFEHKTCINTKVPRIKTVKKTSFYKFASILSNPLLSIHLKIHHP